MAAGHSAPRSDSFFNHPKADDALVAKFKKASSDAGVGLASTLPVLRWSSPDPDAREAAVRYFKRVLRITELLEIPVIGTEFSGRPEKAEESERAFYRSMEELLPLIENQESRFSSTLTLMILSKTGLLLGE